jgi:hypothetical protein
LDPPLIPYALFLSDIVYIKNILEVFSKRTSVLKLINIVETFVKTKEVMGRFRAVEELVEVLKIFKDFRIPIAFGGDHGMNRPFNDWNPFSLKSRLEEMIS